MADSFLTRLFGGELGFKTLAGAVIMLIAAFGKYKGWLDPGSAELILTAGGSVAAIGIRDAQAKASKKE